MLEQNIQDPRETGVAPLQGLPHRFKQSQITQGQTEFQMEQPLVQSVGTPELGQSVYDKKITDSSQLVDLNETRAELQPGLHKVGAGLIKGAVLAGTTFAQGTAGLVIGLGSLATGGYDGVTQFSDFWNNDFTKAMDEINQWSEATMPNYYTQKENQNRENGEWYKNIFTANFLGDTLIKNMGFMVGAMYSGKLWTGAAGKAMQLGTAKSAVTGTLDDTARASLGTAAMSGNPASVTGALSQISKGITYKNLTQAAVGAVTGAIGEASIEAYHGNSEFLQGEKDNWDNYFEANKSKLYGEIVAEVSQNAPDLPFEQKQEIINQRLQEEYDNGLQKIGEIGGRVGNSIFLTQLPVLTMSNLIQFGKFFSGGYRAAAQTTFGTAKSQVRKMTKEILNEAGEVVGYSAKRSPLQVAGALTKNAFTEGSEEMTQAIISHGSKLYGGAKINDYFDAAVDPLAEEESMDILQGLWKGAGETLTSPHAYEEFFVGALFGAVGLPSFSRVNGKIKMQWQGGVQADIKQSNRDLAAARKGAEQITAAMQDGKIDAMVENIIKHNVRENQKEVALENNDPFEYKNAEHKQLIETAQMFESIGRIDEFYKTIEAAGKVTKEELDVVKQQGVREDGSSMFEGMQDDEIIEHFTKQSTQMKESLDNYRKISQDLKIQIGDIFQREDLNYMTWMFANADNLESRFKQSWDEIKNNREFVESLSKFTYTKEDGTVSTLNDVFNESPMDALQILGQQESKIVENQNKKVDNVNTQQERLKAKKDKRGLKQMEEKLDRLVTTAKQDTELVTKFQEAIGQMQDLPKLAQHRSNYINLYHTYLLNPELIQQEKEETLNNANGLKVAKTKSKLKKQFEGIQTYEQYVELFNAVPTDNHNLRNEIEEELEQSGNEFAKQRRAYTKNLNSLTSQIDRNTSYTQEQKDQAKQLINQVSEQSSNPEDLLNFTNYITEEVQDDQGNIVDSNGAKNLIDDVIKTIISYNNSKVGQTGESTAGTSQQGNAVTNPSNAVTVKTVIDTNVTNINNQLAKEKQILEDNKTGSVYQFMSSAIPEVDVAQRAQGLLVDFDVTHPGFTTLYNVLRDSGAFDYIRKGKLSVGSKVTFEIDNDLNQTIERDNIANGRPSALVITLKSGEQTIGFLNYISEKGDNYLGVAELRDRIQTEYNEWIKEDRAGQVFKYTKESTEVGHIFPGIMDYIQENQPLNSLEEGSFLGIMTDVGIEVPGQEVIAVSPNDISNHKGRVYLVTKGADGKYYPSLVHVKRFNDFLQNNKLDLTTQLGKNLDEVFSQMAQATEPDNITNLISTLNGLIYLNGVHINLVGIESGRLAIQFRKDGIEITDGVVFLKEKDTTTKGTSTINTEEEGGEIIIGGTITAGAPKPVETIVADIIQQLQKLDLNIQINKDDLSDSGKVKGMLSDNLLSLNIVKQEMRGAWFMLKPINPQTLELMPTMSPANKRSSSTSSVTNSPDKSGSTVIYNQQIYFKETDTNNLFTVTKDAQGKNIYTKLQDLSITSTLIDLFSIKEAQGTSKATQDLYAKNYSLDTVNYVYYIEPNSNKAYAYHKIDKTIELVNSSKPNMLTVEQVKDGILNKNTPAKDTSTLTGIYTITPEMDAKVQNNMFDRQQKDADLFHPIIKEDNPKPGYFIDKNSETKASVLTKALLYDFGTYDGQQIGYIIDEQFRIVIFLKSNGAYLGQRVVTETSANNNTQMDLTKKFLNKFKEDMKTSGPFRTKVLENINKQTVLNTITTELATEASTLTQEESIADSKYGSALDDMMAREVTTQAQEPWNKRKELVWFKKAFPNLPINQVVKIHKGLMMVNGKQAWGAYKKAAITISDIAATGTLYHEAFHLVMDTILSNEEKTEIFTEARERWGNKTDNQLEELLAEEFRMYVATQIKNKSLGRKIINFFKDLLGLLETNVHSNKAIDKLFADINSGTVGQRLLTKFNQNSLEDLNNFSNFANLSQDTRKYLGMKGFNESNWNLLTVTEKENEVKCVTI